MDHSDVFYTCDHCGMCVPQGRDCSCEESTQARWEDEIAQAQADEYERQAVEEYLDSCSSSQ